MKIIDQILFVVAGATITCFLALVLTSEPRSIYHETQTAIKECERHLPRNQHCVYRITAEVKKDAL